MPNKKAITSIPVFFEKIEDVKSNDERFLKVKIFLMHTGLNINESIFEKEVIDEAIPTLQYIPINGFIESNMFNEKDFKGHEYIITKDDKHGVHRKYIGHAYGVILSNEDNNAHYEKRTCDDGVEREFLVVNGVLWSMFEDSVDVMLRDEVKNHSMELYEPSVEGYEDDEGIFHFTKFSFRAACILSNTAEPAMMNSTVELDFTTTDFVKHIQNEIEEKYTSFMKIINEKEGGNIMPKVDFAQTVLQQFGEISNTISNYETITDRWGDSVPRYYAADVQDNEVIVVDRKNNYNYYGMTFTVNGDKVNINFDSCKRKKVVYADYEDGASIEGSFDFGKHIENIEKTAFEKVSDSDKKVSDAEGKVANFEAKLKEAESKISEIETNFEKVKTDYEVIKPKYDEYVKAENEANEKAILAKKDAVFAKFEEELKNTADFVSLKEQKDKLSVEDIETKCSVLFTKQAMANKKMKPENTDFSKNDSLTVGVPDNDDDNQDCIYVPTKYGNIKTHR